MVTKTKNSSFPVTGVQVAGCSRLQRRPAYMRILRSDLGQQRVRELEAVRESDQDPALGLGQGEVEMPAAVLVLQVEARPVVLLRQSLLRLLVLLACSRSMTLRSI